MCASNASVIAKPNTAYQACFAAGTLVHTDAGLMPMESLRIGTRVLAQPKGGGERDYRPVINKVATLDQPVCALQVKVQGAEHLTTIITTGNHHFWVATPLARNDHWLAAECLEPGFILQLADGSQASVLAAGLIRRTQHNHILFAAADRAGIGMVLGLEEGRISLVDDS